MLTQDRIRFIDGLRGAAILLVILFHVYARWPGHVPYGDAYSGVTRYGHLGVQLFFMISGFVILMTLERTSTFRQFIWKRWLRLFPAMLLCSVLIYATATFFSPRPAGNPTPIDFLPGLLFIDPPVLSRLIGTRVISLDGAFWSIYVEVKFYVLIGIAYFAAGRTVALSMLAVVYAAWALLMLTGYMPPVMKVLELLGARHFPWFLAGALLFLQFTHGGRRHLLAAGCVAATLWQFNAVTALVAVIVSVAFFLPVCTPLGRVMLSSRPAQVVGVASYPLYLLHQNISVSAVAKLGAVAPWVPGFLLPVLPILGLLAVSWWIATRAEPEMRAILSRISTRAGAPAAAVQPPRN